LPRPTLRHFPPLAEIVALGRQLAREALIVRSGHRRGARHDPDVVARVAPDHRLRVVGIEIRNQKLVLARPEKLPGPRRLVHPVDDETAGMVALGGTGETPVVEGDHSVDHAVDLGAVGLNAVVRRGFDQRRDPRR
jgi:hypothetical protein